MTNGVDETILRKIAGAPIGRFRGEPWYDPSGDCLTWHFRNEESYGERIDSRLTLYKSFDTDEIVGFQVRGV